MTAVHPLPCASCDCPDIVYRWQASCCSCTDCGKPGPEHSDPTTALCLWNEAQL